MKTIKRLSDGTIAKEGLVVVCLNGDETRGNLTGVTTQITKLLNDEGDADWVQCRWMPEPEHPRLKPDEWMYERIDLLRKATRKERELFLKGV